MFHTLFYEPVYNLLVIVLNVVPMHDIGAAIIIVTLLVKLLLLPFNMSALRSQYIMKRAEGELSKIKEQYKSSPQEASKKMMELYRREKINPFASLFAIIIQIPIFFALYFAFSKGFKADPDSLYSFVSFPDTLHTMAFGLFDVTERNIFIAVIAGITSYFLARRQTASMGTAKKESHEETFQDHFMKSMKVQMLYILPLIVGFSSAVLPAALGLYWSVSNIISYLQDVYMKWKLSHLHTA